MHPSASTGYKFDKSQGFFAVVLFGSSPIPPFSLSFAAPHIYLSKSFVVGIACRSKMTEVGGGGAGKTTAEMCGPLSIYSLYSAANLKVFPLQSPEMLYEKISI
jgi:hypothetical protein